MNDKQNIKVGDLCKHFKGHSLEEKNIYRILHLNVTYSGDHMTPPSSDLCVYENIFQNRIFTREASEVFEELPADKQLEFNQTYRVEKLTPEEIQTINSEEFKVKKLSMPKK